MNISRIVMPALRVELKAALYRASESNKTVESLGIPAEINGQQCLVDLRVAPAVDIAPGFLRGDFREAIRRSKSGRIRRAGVTPRHRNRLSGISSASWSS